MQTVKYKTTKYTEMTENTFSKALFLFDHLFTFINIYNFIKVPNPVSKGKKLYQQYKKYYESLSNKKVGLEF